MDLERFEAGFTAYAEQARTVGDPNPALLAGTVAMNELRLQALREAEAERRSNYEFLCDFSEFLPRPSANGGAIEVQSAREARQVQAHVLWVHESHSNEDTSGTLSPYYIVGECTATADQYTKGKVSAMHLLLFAPFVSRGGQSDRLRVVTVRDDELSAVREIARNRIAIMQGFGDEQLDAMFSPDTGMLRVGPYPREESLMTRLLRVYDTTLDLSAYRIKDPGSARRSGLHAMVNRDIVFKGRIENDDLDRFDVLQTLSGLAVAFGKQDDLLGLIHRHKKEAAKRR